MAQVFDVNNMSLWRRICLHDKLRNCIRDLYEQISLRDLTRQGMYGKGGVSVKKVGPGQYVVTPPQGVNFVQVDIKIAGV